MGAMICYAGVWMDVDKDTKVAVSFTNNLIELGVPEMRHTINLTVPVTGKNSQLLGWGHDAQNYGVRHMEAGMLSVEGTLIRGRIGVVSCSGNRFNMLFTWGIGNVAGFDDTLQSLLWFQGLPSIQYGDKDTVLSNSTLTWGWVNYDNNNHNNGSMDGTGGMAQVSPCANLGWLLRTAAASLGYTVDVDGVNIGSMAMDNCHNPYMYMFSLPTCNMTGNKFTVNIRSWYTAASVGVPPTISVSGAGSTLDAAGLALMNPYRWVRGWMGNWFNAYVLAVLRDLTIAFPGRVSELVPSGETALDFMEAVNDDNRPTTRDFAHTFTRGNVFAFGQRSEFGTALFNLRKWQVDAFEIECFDALTYPNGYDIEVSHPGTDAVPNTNISIIDNLPDLTLSQLLQAFCRLICACWDVDKDNMTINITTFDSVITGGTLVWDEATGVQVAEGEILRYPQGWAKHNYLRSKSEEAYADTGWERDIRVDSDMVEDERVIAELPWMAGDGVNGSTVTFHDIEVDGDGGFSRKNYSGIMVIDPDGGEPLHISYIDAVCGIGERFGRFTEQADEAAVEVLIGFGDFENLKADAVVVWKGRNWLVRSATWQDGKCTMRLLSCDFKAVAQ